MCAYVCTQVKTRKMFSFWEHTGFLAEGAEAGKEVTYTKRQLDGAAKVCVSPR